MEKIRRAVPGDTDKISGLLIQVEHVHHLIRPDIFRGPEPHVKFSPDEINAMIQDDKNPVFVFDRDGTVAGYAFTSIREILDDRVMNDMKYMYVEDLCVDAPQRGAGIGKKLFRFICDYARHAGCGSVFLNVWHGNDAATRFYENLGMTPQRVIMEKNLCGPD